MIYINRMKLNITDFPDGTKLLKHNVLPQDTQHVEIAWFYDNDAELFQLQCVVDALRNNGHDSISLYMPYVPNARMDRVKTYSEVFTLKSFAKIINALNFTSVTVLDVHSYVSEALIDRIVVNNPISVINTVLSCTQPKPEDFMFFFPDEGAMKRYSSMIENLGYPYTKTPYVFGMKKRDWATGELQGTTVLGPIDKLPGKTILIIDDICSKGGTFYHSAKALKALGVGDIDLYVSHLENSVHDGEMISSGLIRNIYSTNSIFRAEEKSAKNIHIIEL